MGYLIIDRKILWSEWINWPLKHKCGHQDYKSCSIYNYVESLLEFQQPFWPPFWIFRLPDDSTKYILIKMDSLTPTKPRYRHQNYNCVVNDTWSRAISGFWRPFWPSSWKSHFPEVEFFRTFYSVTYDAQCYSNQLKNILLHFLGGGGGVGGGKTVDSLDYILNCALH